MVCSLAIARAALVAPSVGGAAVFGGGFTSWTTSGAKKYDVWGAVRSGNFQYPNTKYCANLGHISDDKLGLIYMRARYYEPSSGRFISEDPAYDGKNWYVYCGNDPVNYIDGSGESKAKYFDWLRGVAWGLLKKYGLNDPISKTVAALCDNIMGATAAVAAITSAALTNVFVRAAAQGIAIGVGMILIAMTVHQFILAFCLIGIEVGDSDDNFNELREGWESQVAWSPF